MTIEPSQADVGKDRGDDAAVTKRHRERLLRIGAELADRGTVVPYWLLQEATSSTAMSHDGEGTEVLEEPGETGEISVTRTEG